MPAGLDKPIQLLPLFQERVWGRNNLAPYFPELPQNRRIGEVWFTFKENLTSLGCSLGDLIKERPEILGNAADTQHSDICPLLVKLLFTTERLSVQVHPDDEYAWQHHQSLGKTEAWYVIDAQPPGEVAVGFRHALSPERLRSAAESGEIEHLLDWKKVAAGDVIFTPAGTVHAIGAGLTICEIQENSDITYRLYDYGRPRELHLDHGARVSHLGPHRHECEAVAIADWREELLGCSYFRMERLRPKASIQVGSRLPYYLLLICLKGSGMIGEQPFAPGQAWMIPAGGSEVKIDGPASEWIVTYAASEPVKGITSE